MSTQQVAVQLLCKFCDLQVHSPRDPRYKGWTEALMTLEHLGEWAEQLLKECRKRGVQAIGVTDHHDLLPGLIVLQIAYTRGFDDIWVFPGMELTSSNGLQAVLLIDPTALGEKATFRVQESYDVQQRVIGAIGQNISASANPDEILSPTPWKNLESLAKLDLTRRKTIFQAPQTKRLTKDLETIARDLESVLPDKFVLLPNLEKSQHGVCGNESGLGLYRQAGWWFVGGIIGGNQVTDNDTLAGRRAKDWGTRVVTYLNTSDQRGKDSLTWFSDDFGRPERGSYVKLSECSTQSIIQALISGENRRVFRAIPSVPGDRIEKLSIANVPVLEGDSEQFYFSPNLNALIGGRGTGKSLALSALVRLFNADLDWLQKRTTDEASLLPWEKRHLSLFDEGGPFYSVDCVIEAEYVKEPGVRYKLTIGTSSLPQR